MKKTLYLDTYPGLFSLNDDDVNHIEPKSQEQSSQTSSDQLEIPQSFDNSRKDAQNLSQTIPQEQPSQTLSDQSQIQQLFNSLKEIAKLKGKDENSISLNGNQIETNLVKINYSSDQVDIFRKSDSTTLSKSYEEFTIELQTKIEELKQINDKKSALKTYAGKVEKLLKELAINCGKKPEGISIISNNASEIIIKTEVTKFKITDGQVLNLNSNITKDSNDFINDLESSIQQNKTSTENHDTNQKKSDEFHAPRDDRSNFNPLLGLFNSAISLFNLKILQNPPQSSIKKATLEALLDGNGQRKIST